MVAAQMLGGMGSAQEMMLVVLVAQNNCSGAFCSRCQNSAFAWSRFGSTEFIGDSSKYLTLRGDRLRLDFTPIGVSPPSRFCRSRRTT
jgi:hypothetical protein